MIKSVHVMVAAALAVWASVGICETYKYSANGRYLLIEPLSKDVVRFEVGAKNTGAATNILNSAMISTTDLGDPPQGRLSGNTVTTQNLRVTVNPSTLCVDVQDTKRNQSLGKICPGLLEQDWKNLLVESPSTQNIYGLGQYFEGPLSTDGDWNHRAWDPLADGFGSRLRGYNGGANNMSMFPIAYFLGSGRQNFAMFVDSIYKQMWDFRQTPWNVGMWGDQIRFYMIAGDNLVALRKTYMQLTGRPPVPPKNVFGLWVSQFGFKSWDEIQERLKTLRQAKFPVDGFGMDLQWFGGTFGDPDHSRMGSLQWDERAFPSPAAHIAALNRDDGVQLMLIEEPYIANNLPEHQDLAAKGFLVKDCQGCAPTFLNSNPWWGRGGMVDYTNPEAGKY